MKIRSKIWTRWKSFDERTTICCKYLTKDIKLSSFLGGNPRNILIFIDSVCLLNFGCLKFSFNFV